MVTALSQRVDHSRCPNSGSHLGSERFAAQPVRSTALSAPRHRAPAAAPAGASPSGRARGVPLPLGFLITAFACAGLLIAAPLAILFASGGSSGGAGVPGGST